MLRNFTALTSGPEHVTAHPHLSSGVFWKFPRWTSYEPLNQSVGFGLQTPARLLGSWSSPPEPGESPGPSPDPYPLQGQR